MKPPNCQSHTVLHHWRATTRSVIKRQWMILIIIARREVQTEQVRLLSLGLRRWEQDRIVRSIACIPPRFLVGRRTHERHWSSSQHSYLTALFFWRRAHHESILFGISSPAESNQSPPFPWINCNYDSLEWWDIGLSNRWQRQSLSRLPSLSGWLGNIIRLVGNFTGFRHFFVFIFLFSIEWNSLDSTYNRRRYSMSSPNRFLLCE